MTSYSDAAFDAASAAYGFAAAFVPNEWARIATVAISFIVIAIADQVLKHLIKTRNGAPLRGRYEFLHSVSNTITVVLCFPGMIETLRDPINAAKGPTEINGFLVIIAIHCYHVVAFRPLPMIEWVHHILMVGCIAPIVWASARGSIVDYCSFFLSGLPGAVDYALLVLVKNKRMDRVLEKRINSAINTWLRTPFTLIGGFILFQLTLYDESITPRDRIACLAVASLVAWNALYFGRRVVQNYGSNMPQGSEPHVS
tara:strand:- start:216 stop:983 length:768 start_codon:yes stop_codon:yes gene_type:complete